MPPDNEPGRILRFEVRRQGSTVPGAAPDANVIVIDPEDCGSLIEAYLNALRAARTYTHLAADMGRQFLAVPGITETEEMQRIVDLATADAAEVERSIQMIAPFRRS